MKISLIPLLVFLTVTSFIQAQVSPKEQGLLVITPSSVQGPLEFLASDWMTGRETGTKGEFMASDYIASVFKTIGLKPGGSTSRTNPGWFQNINFIQYRPGDRQECAIILQNGQAVYQTNLTYRLDYSVTAGSMSVETKAPVVFVGYGIFDKKLKQDDFKGLDVKGCILIRVAGYPGSADPGSENFKRFTSDDPMVMRQLDQSRDQEAIRRGAIGIIEIRRGLSGFTPVPANDIFRYNTPTYEGDVPFNSQAGYRTAIQGLEQPSLMRISLSDRAFNLLTDGCGIDFAGYEKAAAAGNVKPGRMPAGRFLNVATTVDSRIIRGRNVVGVLEGEDTKKCIVAGAHYDHMGQIGGFIYNGSDDNASGTAGIIAIARAMIATGVKPKVSVVFCAWTAEEKGLLGSAWYASHPLIKDILCYMNYDMISRTALDDSTGRKCDFNYSSGLPYIREITEKHIKDYSLGLDMEYKSSPQPVGGSDFSSFSRQNIPIFLIHGKFTPDYHQYTDHSDKAVMPYMTDIVKLGYLNIFELANRNW